MKKMRIRIKLIGLFFITSSFASSQNVEISIGQDMSIGKLDYFWSGKVTDGDNKRDIFGFDFFISLAAKVKPDFYLKTVLATNDFEDLVSIKWEVDGVQKSFFGKVRKNQIALCFLPEYRSSMSDGVVFFVNGGPSFTKPLYGSNQDFSFSDFLLGIAINSGVNVRLNKNLGIAVSLGFRKNFYADHNAESPDISIEKIAFGWAFIYAI